MPVLLFGLATIDQVLPSHVSTSVLLTAVALALPLPTAVQELADRHDTPFRVLTLSPGGVGLETIDQVVPFHDSTRGCG